MDTFIGQRASLIAQLSDLWEQRREHHEQIEHEIRHGYRRRPTRAERRSAIELDAQIGSLERKLARVEAVMACQPGCSCMGVLVEHLR